MSTNLVRVTDYAITANLDEVKSLAATNLGNDKITLADLEFVRVPKEGKKWQIQSINSATGFEEADEVKGVIVHWTATKSYWARSLDDSIKSPPDCLSRDGLVGEGTPGGMCANCPLNQWDTGKNGSKACKEKRLLFIVKPDELLPSIVVVPTGSVANISSFFKKLMSKRIPSNAVEVSLRLGTRDRMMENSDGNRVSMGQSFTTVEPMVVRHLDAEAIKAIQEAAKLMMPTMKEAADHE